MITIKTPEEIEIMREGGRILALIMRELEKNVKAGIKTKELEILAEKLILKSGGKCSFKGYHDKEDTSLPYPACLCTSVNEVIVHEVPSEKVLREGDIISLDLGIFFPIEKFLRKKIKDLDLERKFPNLKKGFHLDMAVTLGVGKISFEAQRLIRATKKALKLGIKKAIAGNTFGDVGNTIQRYVESQGFNVVRELCGHGIGGKLHEEPKILNYGKRKSGEKIKEGMVFCLEPMVTMGSWKIKRTNSGFGYQTQDNSLACHFEHTIAVTKKGSQILTELNNFFRKKTL